MLMRNARGARLACTIAVLELVTVVALPAMVHAAYPRQGAMGEQGAVDTLSGPGFCKQGTGVLDQTSGRVRGLAVSQNGPGTVLVETGPTNRGLIARVGSPEDVSVPALVVSTGIRFERGNTSVSSPGGRLASDGAGGAFIAAGAKLLHLNGGLVPAAGDPQAPDGKEGKRSSGDGGPRLAARFKFILGVAGDEAGNAYVADEIDRQAGTFRVRFINLGLSPVTFYEGTPRMLTVAPGTVDTIVGQRADGRRPASGPGLEVLAGTTPSLAVASHRLYLAWGTIGAGPQRTKSGLAMINMSGESQNDHGVLAEPGQIMTLTQSNGEASAEQTRPASLNLSSFSGIDADRRGNLYLADSRRHRILKLDASGTLSTFAGLVAARRGGFNGNERPATSAMLNAPADVEVGPQGRVYVSDEMNWQVRVVDPAGIIRAAQGNGTAVNWTCRTKTKDPTAQLRIEKLRGSPQVVAADRRGNVFFAVDEIDQIKKLGEDGKVTPVLTGLMPGKVNIELSRGGILYVLEPKRLRVVNTGPRSLRVHGLTVSPGENRVLVEPPGGKTSAAQKIKLSGVGGLALDPLGNLILADGPNGVYRMDARGEIEKIFGRSSGSEGRCCSIALDVAADPSGNLYLLEAPGGSFNMAGGPRVWFANVSRRPVLLHGRTVAPGAHEPVAGTKDIPADIEHARAQAGGAATATPLITPSAIDVDSRSNLYIADRDAFNVNSEGVVFRVDERGQISRIAGAGGGRTFNGDGLPGRLTALRSTDISVDHCGNLLLADAGNRRVRRLNLTSSCFSSSGREMAKPADSDPRRVGGEAQFWAWLPWTLGTLGVLTAIAGGLLMWRFRSARR